MRRSAPIRSAPPDPETRRRIRNLLLLAAVGAGLLLPFPLGLGLAGAAAAVRVLLVGARLLAAYRRRRHPSPAPAAPVVKLGVDARGRSVVLSEQDLAAHGLILGASGSGKSTTMLRILSAQIARGAPVVAIDLKGDPAFARALDDACARVGRPVRVWTLDGGAQWNPLANGNATECKDKLIATERFTEPHYKRAAERYLQLACGVLLDGEPSRPPTLEDVVEVLDPAGLLAAARRLPPERAARIGAYVDSLTRDQLSAVRGLGTRLAIITESHTGAFLRGGDAGAAAGAVDLRAALRGGGEVVVFSLNSSRYGELAAQLGALAVQDVITAMGARPEGAPLATVAIDEFSALPGENVLQLFARGRGFGIGAIVATQELADLDRAARGLRDQLVGSSNLKLIHRQDVPASARAAAEMAGTMKAWERTYADSGGLFGGPGSRGGTRRLVDRPVVEPAEISRLGTGQVVRVSKTPTARTDVVRVSRDRGDIGGLDR